MTEEIIKPVREFLSTVYIVRDGMVLLTWNKKVNKFIPVGGHIDENELPCESVIREAKEESGFDVELVDIDGTKGKEVVYPTGGKRMYLARNINIGLDMIKPDHHHINLAYVGKVVGGDLLKESDEGTELRWFTLEELDHEDVLDNVREEALKSIEIMQKHLEGKEEEVA